MMVKVLHVIGKRPVGGIGSFVYNYQCHFNSDDLKVDYLLFDDKLDGLFDEKVKLLGSTVYVLPALKSYRWFSLWKQIDEFMRLTGREYTIVHLHSVNIGFMVLTSAKKYGVKNLISHSHATVYSDKAINAIRNKVLCCNLLKQANIYCACSEAAARFLYGENNLEKVHIFNNAIECDKYKFDSNHRKEIRDNYDLHGKLVIGNIGRFCKQKNQLFLIDIFEKCLERNSNVILMLVGDGPLKKNVEEKVQKLGIQNSVIFTGQRNDVEKILQAMDVFVLPSLFEGLPVIGIEVQAAGLPMIVSSAVTDELNLTDVKFVSLDRNPDEWASIILEHAKTGDRENGYKLVKDAGYDIVQESLRLQNFYLNLV